MKKQTDNQNKGSEANLRNQSFVRKYYTTNSFTQKPSIQQIITILIVLFEIGTFYGIFTVRIQSLAAQIVFQILFGVTLIIQIICYFYCCCCDPSDKTMIEIRNCQKQITHEQANDLLFCQVCQSLVQISSRHCKLCGRCVEGFDHHCKWLNNCIGEKNYRVFLVMIVVVTLNFLIYVASIIMLSCEQLWYNFLAEIIILWVVILLYVVLAILVFNLMLFHIYLIRKNMTTYAFIKNEPPNDNVFERQKKIDNFEMTQQIIENQRELFIMEAPIKNFIQEKDRTDDNINPKNISQVNQIQIKSFETNVFDRGSTSNRDKTNDNVGQYFHNSRSLKLLLGGSVNITSSPQKYTPNKIIKPSNAINTSTPMPSIKQQKNTWAPSKAKFKD